MNETGMLGQLTGAENALLEVALTAVAPDLLALLKSEESLGQGPRLRLDDVLYGYAQQVMTPDYRHTSESEAVERLISRLREIQPVRDDRLKISQWKKGDPIPRGMARYEEIEDDA